MIDKAKINLIAGNGGDGKVSFLSVKYNPKGGPDGGDGGNGGSIYLKASTSKNSLSHLKGKDTFKADKGEAGGIRKMSGRNADPLYISVPVGTEIYEKNSKTEELDLLGDLTEEDGTLLVVKGGKGGIGNVKFKSSRNQAPKIATRGKSGEHKQFILKLKLLADVGLIGYPSVGKTTLINTITNSNYKTAAYEFTTLQPGLGVLKFDKDKSLVIADLPGLIDGASSGKGLGDQFLSHVERCFILVHLLDPTRYTDAFYSDQEVDKDVVIAKLVKDYSNIRTELDTWSKDLLDKEEIVVINKVDLPKVNDFFVDNKKEIEEKIGKKIEGISSFTGKDVDILRKNIVDKYKLLESVKEKLMKKKKDSVLEITMENIPNRRVYYKEAEDYIVKDFDDRHKNKNK